MLAQGNETLKRWHYQHVGWEIQWDCCCLYFWRCRSICVCVSVCHCVWKREERSDGIKNRDREKKYFSHISYLIRAHHSVIQQNCEFVWRCYSGLQPQKVVLQFPPHSQAWKYIFLTRIIMISAWNLIVSISHHVKWWDVLNNGLLCTLLYQMKKAYTAKTSISSINSSYSFFILCWIALKQAQISSTIDSFVQVRGIRNGTIAVVHCSMLWSLSCH